jgi:hypothetical protein
MLGEELYQVLLLTGVVWLWVLAVGVEVVEAQVEQGLWQRFTVVGQVEQAPLMTLSPQAQTSTMLGAAAALAIPVMVLRAEAAVVVAVKTPVLIIITLSSKPLQGHPTQVEEVEEPNSTKQVQAAPGLSFFATRPL